MVQRSGFGLPFALAARLDPKWGVFLSDDALREVVGTSGLELHEFWAWGVRGVRAAVPHWAVSRCRDVARVGWGVDVFFFIILGLVFFVFRHGIVMGECDTVRPWVGARLRWVRGRWLLLHGIR